MPNKYIRVGATFNGDGTSSALAASNGGVGAWNTLAYFEGTVPPAPGVLAAGDVVYIRSKNEAGANLDKTIGAAITLGSAVGTENNRLTWILDNGEVWPGIDGTLIYTNGTAGTTYAVTFVAHGNYIAKTRGALGVLGVGTNSGTAQSVNVNTGNYQEGLSFVTTVISGNRFQVAGATGAVVTQKGCNYKFANRTSSSGGFTGTTNYSLTLIDPDIELVQNLAFHCFYLNSSTFSVWVFGGKLYGVGATTGAFVATASVAGVYEFHGFEYPKTMRLTQATMRIDYSMFGADHGFGSVSAQAGGQLDSRQDGNYPYLTATYPDSVSTGWSWKLYPQFAYIIRELALDMAKVFTDTAATKTITLELLIADTYPGITNKTLFLQGYYYDNATGEQRAFSTREFISPTALTASTVTWNSTSGTPENPGYGSVSLLKRKIEFATPTAIKQDSLISLRLVCNTPSGSADDLIFVCPDFKIT